MHRNKVIASISALERLGTDMQRIAAVQDGAAAGQLILLRRQYAQAFQDMIANAETALAALPEVTSQPLSAPFRKLLNDARAAVAAHQARWPAVTISHDGAAYAESSGHVTATLKTLMGWLKDHLLPVLPH